MYLHDVKYFFALFCPDVACPQFFLGLGLGVVVVSRAQDYSVHSLLQWCVDSLGLCCSNVLNPRFVLCRCVGFI